MRAKLARIGAQEDINFLLTNRIPRRLLTIFMGWFSKIEHPAVRTLSIATWRLFCDVDLSDARETRFRSMHDCFTRKLKEGARPADAAPRVLASPCDAIVGACGAIEGNQLHQIKGFAYTLEDLIGRAENFGGFRDGQYATLRLTAGMYHRFHAPHDLDVEEVHYVAGDTWNVNPTALKRVEKLFCRNERALILARLTATGHPIMLVAVGAILVASIRLNFVQDVRTIPAGGLRPSAGEAHLAKGDEMGWFEHGSTILVLAPPGFRLCDDVRTGTIIRAGQPLMRLPGCSQAAEG